VGEGLATLVGEGNAFKGLPLSFSSRVRRGEVAQLAAFAMMVENSLVASAADMPGVLQ